MFRFTSSRKLGFAFVAVIAVASIAAAVFKFSPAPPRASLRISAPSLKTQPVALSSAAQQKVRAGFAALPLAFEPNEGQADPQVKYLARGTGYKLCLSASEAILAVRKPGDDSEVRTMMADKRLGPARLRSLIQQHQRIRAQRQQVAVVRMQMLGAGFTTAIAASGLQSGKINYFLGNDPSKWRSGVPLYSEVRYQNLYPGVDLTFHGSGQQLEFDYLVKAGANAATIALGFAGADQMSINSAGDLVLATSAGPVEIHRPAAYQNNHGSRQSVPARFEMKGVNRVSFALGPYDHNRALVIDPTVTYSTYFGGNLDDYGLGIATDASGNAYVAGATESSSIPGHTGGTDNGSFDIFVTKINSAGALQFTTVFGGSGDDFPGGIAVDSAGIYVAGTTASSDFPVTAGAAQTKFLGGVTRGDNDAFAAKLTLSGSLTGGWATYIAGSDSDSGLGVAVDASHNVYVAGETFSVDLGCAIAGTSPCLHNALPHGSALNLGQPSSPPNDDGYIAKLNSTGTAYSLLTYIGGSGPDLASGIAVDGSANIYISGETASTDLPTTPGVVQPTCGTDAHCNTGASGPLDDAFIASVEASLAGYNYVTYYGGSNADDGFAVAADAGGDAFITGATSSSDFPTVSPYQSALGASGAQNAFVVELNPSGSHALYSSYLGGSGTDMGLAIDVDGAGNAYVTGQTGSSDFPTVDPLQTSLSGNTDAFVSVLSPGQNTALFSTFLGGGGDEDQLGGDIALDSNNNILVTGDTDSGNGSTAKFPLKQALDGTYGGGQCVNGGLNSPCTDAFIASYTTALAPDFAISATVPNAVSPGTAATSTISVIALNGYNSQVNLSCSVSGAGSPAPTCSASTAFSTNPVTPGPAPGAATTLTITTTGNSAASLRRRSVFYAMWLPIAGLSLLGISFGSARSRRKKFLGFFMIGLVMTALFLLPACSTSSTTTVTGGCTSCTAPGTYTITITGTGTDANATTNSTQVGLAVN